MKRLKRKDLLFLVDKLIKNIPDSHNAKEHYQSFLKKKSSRKCAFFGQICGAIQDKSSRKQRLKILSFEFCIIFKSVPGLPPTITNPKHYFYILESF